MRRRRRPLIDATPSPGATGPRFRELREAGPCGSLGGGRMRVDAQPGSGASRAGARPTRYARRGRANRSYPRPASANPGSGRGSSGLRRPLTRSLGPRTRRLCAAAPRGTPKSRDFDDGVVPATDTIACVSTDTRAPETQPPLVALAQLREAARRTPGGATTPERRDRERCADAAVICLAYLSGARRAELVALHIADVDPADKHSCLPPDRGRRTRGRRLRRPARKYPRVSPPRSSRRLFRRSWNLRWWSPA